jgi:hypothetical protein
MPGCLDEPAPHCLGDRELVDHLTLDRLVVGPERGRGQADDLGAREPVEDAEPARCHVVVALIDDDQVEEVFLDLVEPAAALGELLDVGDGDVGVVEVAVVGCRVEGGDERPRSQIS